MNHSAVDASKFVPSTEVIAQPVKEQTVLFDMASGNYFALNEIGARTWELMDGNRALAEIVSILCSEYDAPYEVISEDITVLVEQLHADGLVILPEG
jgi:hypothetical protein